MDEKKRNDELKLKEELKLEPDVMFQALVYIELAYKEGLVDLKTYSKIMNKYGKNIKSWSKICVHRATGLIAYFGHTFALLRVQSYRLLLIISRAIA